MSKYGNTGVQGTEGSDGKQKYIYPGVLKVHLIGATSGKSDDKGTPFIGFKFCTEEGYATTDKPEERPVRELKLYLTDNSFEYQRKKIIHLLTKFTKRENADKIAGETLEEYATATAKLTNAIAEKKNHPLVRMKFSGREYEANGETKTAPELGLPPFVEALIEGAEHEVVSDENTKLTFNKSNKYDYQALAKSDGDDFESGSNSDLSSVDMDDLDNI